MLELTSADLLAGPRGRGLCLAVARQLDRDVCSALIEAAHHGADEVRRRDLVDALRAFDSESLQSRQDPILFVDAVEETISHALYWQAPHDADVIAAHPAVMHALELIASAVSTAPAAAWWTEPVELSALRYTSFFDDNSGAPTPPVLIGLAERLDRWRADVIADEQAATTRPTDPEAPVTGRWWSTPALTSICTTARPLAGLGSAELAWREDSLREPHAAVWQLRTLDEPRVWEVDGPMAWTLLVQQYPLEVTDGRRHDWYRTTGRVERWFIPDWEAVAADWDAVHLTVAGYLTSATRALPIADDGKWTVLAGWNPDQTWWLTDILETSAAAPELWRRIDDSSTGWFPAAG